MRTTTAMGPNSWESIFRLASLRSRRPSPASKPAAILGVVNVIATYFAFRYIDRIGRRMLAIGGFLGMAVFMLVAAWGVANLTGLTRVWVIMIGFACFITSFAIGVGGTGWLIQGEVFPTAVRGRAAATCASVNWLANFVIVQWFPHSTPPSGWPG